MTAEKLYKILSAILIPISYLFAFFTIPMIMVALGNPSLLFGVFVFVCILIYTFKSVAFFRKNILTGKPAKANTKEWIRINGIFGLLFVVEIVVTAVVVFMKIPELMTMVHKMTDMVSQQSGQHYSVDDMYNLLRNFVIFFLIYSLILATHIIISFKFLRRYKHLLTL